MYPFSLKAYDGSWLPYLSQYFVTSLTSNPVHSTHESLMKLTTVSVNINNLNTRISPSVFTIHDRINDQETELHSRQLQVTFVLSTATRKPPEPSTFLPSKYRSLFFREVRWPVHDAIHFNSKFQITWKFISILPYILKVWCFIQRRNNFNFTCM
jgi:hypothetical protein